MSAIHAFEDPDDPRNGPKFHTGRKCIERGCDKPAGTYWSHLWCFEHNVARMNNISASLNSMVADLHARKDSSGICCDNTINPLERQ